VHRGAYFPETPAPQAPEPAPSKDDKPAAAESRGTEA
jgi:hypothetical protein